MAKANRVLLQCIHMLSVTERAVYGASMSAVPQLWLNSKIVGLLTLKRPEGRAPTNRQLVDALFELPRLIAALNPKPYPDTMTLCFERFISPCSPFCFGRSAPGENP